MTNDKYYALVDRLISKTNQEAVDWKESGFPNGFQVSFPNYSLILSEQEDDVGSVDYVVRIIDSNGTVIDRFSDADLGGEYFSRMSELYQRARRQSLGVDKALDEILSELELPF